MGPSMSTSNKNVERAAELLLKTIVDEGRFVQTGREFLDAANGLNRDEIMKATAVRLTIKVPKATLDQAEQAIRRDLNRLFGWRDVAELEIAGHA
jgi:hypothetical protein